MLVVPHLPTWVTRARRIAIGIVTAYVLTSALVGGTAAAEPVTKTAAAKAVACAKVRMLACIINPLPRCWNQVRA